MYANTVNRCYHVHVPTGKVDFDNIIQVWFLDKYLLSMLIKKIKVRESYFVKRFNYTFPMLRVCLKQ